MARPRSSRGAGLAAAQARASPPAAIAAAVAAVSAVKARRAGVADSDDVDADGRSLSRGIGDDDGVAMHSARSNGQNCRDAELERIEKRIADLEDRGMRGRKGLRLFEDIHLKSTVGQVIFSQDGTALNQSSEPNGYQRMYKKAAGRASWDDQSLCMKTVGGQPGAIVTVVEFDGEDADDVRAKRGLRRFALESKSPVFADIIPPPTAEDSRGSGGGFAMSSARGSGAASRSGTSAPPLSTTTVPPEEYELLYLGAAGTPSWAKERPARKSNVGDRLQKTAKLSRRFLKRIAQDWNGRTGVPIAYLDGTARPPSREIGPPAGCGMARLAFKNRVLPATATWCP